MGHYDDGTSEQTLIEHWNGTAWKVEPTPNQGGSGDSNDLFGVAADSAGGAWAVGNYYDGTNNETLALHCC